tara:strand:- start:46 stop:567 length:522 start_codon:yes stop_codon:yes gene_type:complete
MSGLSLKMKNKIKKKRGRPRLSDEEKARRKAEREEAKAKARKASPKKRVTSKKFLNQENNQEKIKTYLLTPSGKCPVELYGCDKEAISIWLSQAKNCKKKGTVHTVQSLTYWLRGYFGIFSEEYKIASENVKELSHIFEIKDYDPILKKMYKSVLSKNNLKTVEEYIKTGEVT